MSTELQAPSGPQRMLIWCSLKKVELLIRVWEDSNQGRSLKSSGTGIGDGTQARCWWNQSHRCRRIWIMENNGWLSCKSNSGELGGQCTNLLHSYTGCVLVPELNQSQAEPCSLLFRAHVFGAKSPGMGKGSQCPVRFKTQPHSHLWEGICLTVQTVAGAEHISVVLARGVAGPRFQRRRPLSLLGDR